MADSGAIGRVCLTGRGREPDDPAAKSNFLRRATDGSREGSPNASNRPRPRHQTSRLLFLLTAYRNVDNNLWTKPVSACRRVPVRAAASNRCQTTSRHGRQYRKRGQAARFRPNCRLVGAAGRIPKLKTLLSAIALPPDKARWRNCNAGTVAPEICRGCFAGSTQRPVEMRLTPPAFKLRCCCTPYTPRHALARRPASDEVAAGSMTRTWMPLAVRPVRPIERHLIRQPVRSGRGARDRSPSPGKWKGSAMPSGRDSNNGGNTPHVQSSR